MKLQPTIKDRLKNPQTMTVYRNMIRNAPEETVRELMANMREQADGHPKFIELEQLFNDRFPE